jgi:hypothetical protein
MVHGALEVSKTQLNIGVAPYEIALSRAMICKDCEFKVNVMVGPLKFCQCSKCKCLVAEKIKRAKEDCPINKWSAL